MHDVLGLNQLFRRFRDYESQGDWVRLVMEGASAYAHQIALFSAAGTSLQLLAQSHLELPEGVTFAIAEAAAFESAIKTKEPVTALRTQREVHESLSIAGELATLFPILNKERVVAVLFVGGRDLEASGLELICGLAGVALERHSNVEMHAQIAAVSSPGPSLKKQSWAGMKEPEQTLHRRAERFARVAIADLQLANPGACRAGRERGNLYLLIGKEIDSARDQYRRQFMSGRGMVDYFHRELVAFAAGGDVRKLGADYPGELA